MNEARHYHDLRQVVPARNTPLTEANAELARTNVDLDNFIYTAAHDLRTSITNSEGLLLALLDELASL